MKFDLTIHYDVDTQQLAESLTKSLLKIYYAKSNKRTFYVALSGGSTPTQLFHFWMQHDNLWKDIPISFFWVDERMVPYDSKESNYGEAHRAYFQTSRVPRSNIYPIDTTLSPNESASEYEALLYKLQKEQNRESIFDVAILGMGKDGHTSSIFPSLEDTYEKRSLYLPTMNPQTQQKRIALSMFGITQKCENIFLHIQGEEKKEILQKVIESSKNEDVEDKNLLPMAYVLRHGTNPIHLFTDIKFK